MENYLLILLLNLRFQYPIMIKLMENYLPIILGVCAFLIVLIVVFVLIFKRKDKKKIVIDQRFMDILIESLGGIGNIISCDVDNRRIKFVLKNVNIAKGNVLKDELKATGVIVSGKTLKALFEYEASVIKANISSLL